jgi:hypothetical protein
MMSRLVPKLRFKEFSGEWKEKKLGEVCKIHKGKGISKGDIFENGKLECVRYGELYTDYKEIIKNVKSKTNLNKDNLILSKNNDVLIPSSGETNIDIATAHCILKDNVALKISPFEIPLPLWILQTSPNFFSFHSPLNSLNLSLGTNLLINPPTLTNRYLSWIKKAICKKCILQILISLSILKQPLNNYN